MRGPIMLRAVLPLAALLWAGSLPAQGPLENDPLRQGATPRAPGLAVGGNLNLTLGGLGFHAWADLGLAGRTALRLQLGSDADGRKALRNDNPQTHAGLWLLQYGAGRGGGLYHLRLGGDMVRDERGTRLVAGVGGARSTPLAGGLHLVTDISYRIQPLRSYEDGADNRVGADALWYTLGIGLEYHLR